MHHHRVGRGEPLVLVHGVGSRWQVWEPLLPLLAESFEVFAVDLPGFGASPALPETTVDTLTDALDAFLTEHGLDRPHLAGNSMGGLIALDLAARGRARSVTVFSPIGFWSAAGVWWCRAALGGSKALGLRLRRALPAILGTAAGRTVFLGLLFGKPWALGARIALDTASGGLDAPGFDAALASFPHARLRDGGRLRRIPVTIAWGSRDLLLTYATQSRRARAWLPDARHVTLPGSGHTPFYDDPRRCAELLLCRTAADTAG
ncbi:alpha/beta fold hydrolase [Nocardia sp. alder85J]|uniref:alpha/beta fold hydrolase n=1 Tax=Nocardia sp. alder85J TaxID=2862949 RepID=UPI001CD3CE38|nr:alpha/beta fold hydrolase [Nocardia sp. alder85J]MCX4096288.1 alpha/beta fold hydrolase [Nocardia sp. alder85J]